MGLGLVLGTLLGAGTMLCMFVWAMSAHSNVTVVDLWWAENAERWASLRDILMDEKRKVEK